MANEIGLLTDDEIGRALWDACFVEVFAGDVNAKPIGFRRPDGRLNAAYLIDRLWINADIWMQEQDGEVFFKLLTDHGIESLRTVFAEVPGSNDRLKTTLFAVFRKLLASHDAKSLGEAAGLGDSTGGRKATRL
jgi:hypothetical protein